MTTTILKDPIAVQARHLQLRLWNLRAELWAGSVPSSPIEVLEPGVALQLLGYEVVTDPELGEMYDQGRHSLVAGEIDPHEMIVRISPAFSFEAQRFTAAHELAHAVLHPSLGTLHRDRSISGPVGRRDRFEREADRYASHFLMPEKQVRRRFFECFGVRRLELNVDTAFLLCCSSYDQVLRNWRQPRDFSFAVARATSYAGRPFDSLAGYFKVSPLAMAIQIEEFDLVRFGPSA